MDRAALDPVVLDVVEQAIGPGAQFSLTYATQGFAVSQRNGAWRRAFDVPRPGILNAGGAAAVVSVSCGSPGNCAAGGCYTDCRSHRQGFVFQDGPGTRTAPDPLAARRETARRPMTSTLACRRLRTLYLPGPGSLRCLTPGRRVTRVSGLWPGLRLIFRPPSPPS